MDINKSDNDIMIEINIKKCLKKKKVYNNNLNKLINQNMMY